MREAKRMTDNTLKYKAWCALYLQPAHEHNRREYFVDGYPILSGDSDFQSFFGYIGQKTGRLKNLNPKDRKGILRIEQW